MADDGEAWEPLEPEDSPGVSGGNPPPLAPDPNAQGQPPYSGQPPYYGPPPYYGGQPYYGPQPYYGVQPPPQPKAGSVRTGPLPMHPMNLSDILDGAFKLYKANARVLIAITAAFVVPVQLLSAYLQRDLFGGQGFLTVLNDPSTAEGTGPATGGDFGVLVAIAATVLVLPFVAGAVSRVVAASYMGEELTPGDALRATGRKWWALIAAWVLVHLVEGVALLLCVVPFFFVMPLFVPVAPAIVIENLGPVRGMRRAVRLVKPRLFPVLGIALVSGLLASAVSMALGFVPQATALLIGLRWGWLLLAAGGILTEVVTTPFVAIVATLVYFDGRIRNEGLDLAVMAAEISRSDRPR